MAAAFDARFYGPWLAGVALLLVATKRALQGADRRVSALVLAVLSAFVCTIHYFGIVSWCVAVAAGGVLAWRRGVTPRRLVPMLAGPLALGLCLPLYASQRVGERGRVFAVDLEEILQVFAPNVEVLRGDALDLENQALSKFAPYDVVLSDMAPRTSGNKLADQARSAELYLRALAVGIALGKPGSSFVGKIFMSGDFTEARTKTAQAYSRVQVIRPEGTRTVSSEVFIVGDGLKPQTG
jgi:hypothetical protein